jgi:uncharacterized protein (TIGR02328 family)
MRLWHYGILETLPELQLRSQWRECVAIAKDLHETGFTHHLLINQIMSYDVKHFNYYCYLVLFAMIKRGFSVKEGSVFKLQEYMGFVPNDKNKPEKLFDNWHNKEYLRVCMSNLYEKHFFGLGKSRITDEEWETLCRGYKEITGEEYVI